MPIRIGICRSLQAHKKRQWELKLSQDPQSGYLTIPYNRFLLSTKNGVKPDQCNLKGLQKLLTEDKKNSESGIN